MNKFFKLLLLIAVIALATAPALLAQNAPIGGTSGSISMDKQQLSYNAATGALSIQRGNTVTINTNPPSNVWRTGGNPAPYNGQNSLGWSSGQDLNLIKGSATGFRITSGPSSNGSVYGMLPAIGFGRNLVFGGFSDLSNQLYQYDGIGRSLSARTGGDYEMLFNVWRPQVDWTFYANSDVTFNTRAELFRVAGNGRVSVNQSNAASTFEVNGSQGASYVKLSGATTLGEHYFVWADGATNYLVTLPSAASCPRREYVIRCTNVNKTISNYFDRTNATSNVLKAGETTTLVSDGSSWIQF